MTQPSGPILLLVTGVFDYVPDAQAFPYVVIGEGIEIARNTTEHLGRDIVATLHVWSQAEGFAESLNIANTIIQVLDNTQLTLSQGTAWRCQYDDMHSMRDPDGVTRHIALAFRVGTQM
jgi:hypothetical protein